MIAFIAWTPLHVINIINTKNTYFPDTEADLYIYNEFNGADIVFENMKNEQIFKNIYKVEHKKMGSPLMSKVNVLFNRNTMIELKNDINYDIIFTQGGNYFLKILFGISKKNNPRTELRYIEDGVASYLNITLLNISNFRRRIMNLINPYSMFLTEFTGYYLYNLELTNIDKKGLMYKLPTMPTDSETYAQLQRVFDIKEEREVIENAILYLDQPLEADGYKINEKAILTSIVDNSKGRQLFVKLHPRTKPEKYSNAYHILKTDLPLELCFLSYDFKNTIILSCVSSAAFTPKLMFGISNTFILLADMVINNPEFSSEDERTEQAFRGVSELYQRYRGVGFSNVLMPSTKEELGQLIMEELNENN